MLAAICRDVGERIEVTVATIALMSDIHGNLPALEAVAADLARSQPDAVYVAGDMVNGAPWSADVLDRIADAGWQMLVGNHDDAVMQLGTPRMERRYGVRDRYGALWWTRTHLASRHMALLESLPGDLLVAIPGLPAIRIVHGVPGNFLLGFMPDAPEAWYLRHLASVAEPVVAAGHTHQPVVRGVGRWRVVNPGSVGAPYDRDPRPAYAILRGGASGWRVEIRRVSYDLEAVDRGFRESGLLQEGGVMARLFHRSVMSGEPWVADFLWWMRNEPEQALRDIDAALVRYDAMHGPGHWAFPHATHVHAGDLPPAAAGS